MSSNVAILLRILRKAVQLEDVVEGDLELLLVAHPDLEANGPPADAGRRPVARVKPDSCRELLLRLHRRVDGALTPPEQRQALADLGFAFSRQAVYAAARKLVSEGRLERRRRAPGGSQWEYSIAERRSGS